jgi:hypothetical protein
MFNFSSKTLVNKEYKLSDFLTQIKASKDIREDAKKIDKIIFQNVINADSLNAIEDDEYKAIYVIRILLKNRDVPRLFVEELDKNIAFHTYFIFESNGEVASTIAYKDIGLKVKINSKYYFNAFKREELITVPLLDSIKEVYNFILEQQIKLSIRKNESPGDYITRVKAISKLDFQISKTESAIIYETQPKKKFEYNERLRRYKRKLEELKNVEE